jgi:hypothetical protein
VIQVRWKKEKIGYYSDGALDGSSAYTDKVLQYRVMENVQEIGLQPPIWSEWEDVPTEYVEI